MSVFISYRRADTKQAAGRLSDHLINRFGGEAVVIDIDIDQVGRDYRQVITARIDSADVVLALIGPYFMEEGEDGRPRLDKPDDPVRMELTRALSKDVPIIPVLVDGGKLPDRKDLPDELQDLVYQGAVDLDHESFKGDYARLESEVARIIDAAEEKRRIAAVDAERQAAEHAERQAAEEAERRRRELSHAALPAQIDDELSMPSSPMRSGARTPGRGQGALRTNVATMWRRGKSALTKGKNGLRKTDAEPPRVQWRLGFLTRAAVSGLI